MTGINTEKSNVYLSKHLKLVNNSYKFTVNLDCFLNKDKKLYARLNNIEYNKDEVDSSVVEKDSISKEALDELTNFLLNYFDKYEEVEVTNDMGRYAERIFYLKGDASIVKFTRVTNTLLKDYLDKYKEIASKKKTSKKKTKKKKKSDIPENVSNDVPENKKGVI